MIVMDYFKIWHNEFFEAQLKSGLILMNNANCIFERSFVSLLPPAHTPIG